MREKHLAVHNFRTKISDDDQKKFNSENLFLGNFLAIRGNFQ